MACYLLSFLIIYSLSFYTLAAPSHGRRHSHSASRTSAPSKPRQLYFAQDLNDTAVVMVLAPADMTDITEITKQLQLLYLQMSHLETGNQSTPILDYKTNFTVIEEGLQNLYTNSSSLETGNTKQDGANIANTPMVDKREHPVQDKTRKMENGKKGDGVTDSVWKETVLPAAVLGLALGAQFV